MALITNRDNFGQIKRHLVINLELKYDVKTAIPITNIQLIDFRLFYNAVIYAGRNLGSPALLLQLLLRREPKH